MIRFCYSLIAVCISVYLHVINIDMTETRLAFEYWWVWVLILFGGFVVFAFTDNEREE